MNTGGGGADDGPTARLMIDGGQGGGMFRGLTGLVGMVVVVAVLLGLALGGPLTGLFDRNRQAAETARIQAEAAKLLADAEEAKQRGAVDRQIEQDRAQQQLALEAEREREQIASDRRRDQLVSDALFLLLLAIAVGLFAVLFATAIFIVRKAASLPPKRTSRSTHGTGRILSFPDKRERPRPKPPLRDMFHDTNE